jgi:hypothetical protein
VVRIGGVGVGVQVDILSPAVRVSIHTECKALHCSVRKPMGSIYPSQLEGLSLKRTALWHGAWIALIRCTCSFVHYQPGCWFHWEPLTICTLHSPLSLITEPLKPIPRSPNYLGANGSVVEALCYKPEGRGFDTR